MANPEILDLVSRMDVMEKQIDRLESLEFGTIAFPSGFGAICDVELAAAAGSITLCPVAIPSTFKHLLILYSVQVGAQFGLFETPQELQFNGDTLTNYHYYTRLERAGPINEEAAAGISVADHIRIGGISQQDTGAPNITEHFASGFVFIPDYADSDDDKWKSLVFGNFHRRADVAGGGGGQILYQGGGGAWENTAAITSITISAAGGFTFQDGSRWTLYGL